MGTCYDLNRTDGGFLDFPHLADHPVGASPFKGHGVVLDINFGHVVDVLHRLVDNLFALVFAHVVQHALVLLGEQWVQVPESLRLFVF